MAHSNEPVPSVVRRLAKKHPELAEVVNAAIDQGWTITLTKNHHIRFNAPNGRKYQTSSSPSDWRAFLNFRGSLRRAGLKV